jgi:hypothetical protein
MFIRHISISDRKYRISIFFSSIDSKITKSLDLIFFFQIQELIGFSRLCPGDTYEIKIKYGSPSLIGPTCTKTSSSTTTTITPSLNSHNHSSTDSSNVSSNSKFKLRTRCKIVKTKSTNNNTNNNFNLSLNSTTADDSSLLNHQTQQQWTKTKFAFKITLDDFLFIRLNEIKFLSLKKNAQIGQQLCDTKDLFSTTQTQRLTINANTSGTIKLSMLITWM